MMMPTFNCQAANAQLDLAAFMRRTPKHFSIPKFFSPDFILVDAG